ncbi:hypothetical protein ACVGWW_00005, partial [Enterobacter hormaechei]
GLPGEMKGYCAGCGAPPHPQPPPAGATVFRLRLLKKISKPTPRQKKNRCLLLKKKIQTKKKKKKILHIFY